MTADDMTPEELADYAIALFDSMDAEELASVEGTWQSALQVTRAIKDGLFTADGLTDLAVNHLADLYNDYEDMDEAA